MKHTRTNHTQLDINQCNYIIIIDIILYIRSLSLLVNSYLVVLFSSGCSVWRPLECKMLSNIFTSPPFFTSTATKLVKPSSLTLSSSCNINNNKTDLGSQPSVHCYSKEIGMDGCSCYCLHKCEAPSNQIYWNTDWNNLLLICKCHPWCIVLTYWYIIVVIVMSFYYKSIYIAIT